MLVPWFHNEFRALLNAGLLHGLLDSKPFHALRNMRDWLRLDRWVNLDTKHPHMYSIQDFFHRLHVPIHVCFAHPLKHSHRQAYATIQQHVHVIESVGYAILIKGFK